MSDWQSCLATVSVPPERRRELSCVSTEQRRQILIFHLSIIFVFHRKGKWARQVCVCVCMWVSVFSYLVHVFICRVAVCILPISSQLGKCEHTQCMYTVAFMLLSKPIPGTQTQQSIYSLHCSLIGWELAGGRKHAFVCLYTVCALLWISVFVY